jgi:hypothetical protein
MSETSEGPLYVTRSRARKVRGVERVATLEDGTEMRCGVHGPIKALYRLDQEPNLPLPVDYLVAAAAT